MQCAILGQKCSFFKFSNRFFQVGTWCFWLKCCMKIGQILYLKVLHQTFWVAQVCCICEQYSDAICHFWPKMQIFQIFKSIFPSRYLMFLAEIFLEDRPEALPKDSSSNFLGNLSMLDMWAIQRCNMPFLAKNATFSNFQIDFSK